VRTKCTYNLPALDRAVKRDGVAPKLRSRIRQRDLSMDSDLCASVSLGPMTQRTSKAGSIPAYRKVADDLRTSIRTATNGYSWRLPTEAELAVRHGVSRHTVRRAYQDLVIDGLVERMAGRGTFVLPPGDYLRAAGTIEDLMQLSEDDELRVVEPLALVTDQMASDTLGLPTHSTYRISFLRFHRATPLCVTTVNVPPAIGVGLLKVKALTRSGARTRDTILSLLDQSGERIVTAKQTITSVLAPARIAALIECPAGHPVLKITRLYFDETGDAVDLATNWYNAERYVYRLEIRRTR